MRRHGFLIACIFIALCIASSAKADNGFFVSMPDMPIAQGFKEHLDMTTLFDKAGGRFISFVASSSDKSMCSGVLKFYSNVLPELGWMQKKVNENNLFFERDSENLIIKLDHNGSALEACFLGFELTPF